jgi:hypothetical protein
MITLEQGFNPDYKPEPEPLHKPRVLRKPQAGTDWDNIGRMSEILIDMKQEDLPVKMSVIRKRLADDFGLDVTDTMIRNRLLATHDWWRYLQTLFSPADIRQIERESVELAQNSTIEKSEIANILIEKFCDVQKKKRVREENFNESVGNLVFDALRNAGLCP